MAEPDIKTVLALVESKRRCKARTDHAEVKRASDKIFQAISGTDDDLALLALGDVHAFIIRSRQQLAERSLMDATPTAVSRQ